MQMEMQADIPASPDTRELCGSVTSTRKTKSNLRPRASTKEENIATWSH